MQNCRNNTSWNLRYGNAGRIALALSAWIFLCNYPARAAAGADIATQAGSALRHGKYSEAGQLFESALNAGGDPVRCRVGLLQVLRITGDYKEAEKQLQRFVSELPDSDVLQLEGGRIYRAVGDYVKAEAALKRVLSLDYVQSGVRMDAMRTLADLFEDTGRKAEADRLWDGLIDMYRKGATTESTGLGAVAVAAWRKGAVFDARDMFLDATDPKRGDVSLQTLVDFGNLFLEKYNATEAMVSFKDCLKINDSYPDALVGMARAKKYENDFEVEVYSRAALKINPNCVPARNLLAGLALDAEYYEAALDEIKAALDVNPANLESLSLLADCYFTRGDTAGFEATERKILDFNPGYGDFYQLLAESLASRGKYRQAVDFSRKATGLNPELWPAYVTLGMNLTRIGDIDGGRRAIERAFEGDPFNVWASNSLDLLDQMDTFVESESEHFRFRMSGEDSPVLAPYIARLAEEVYAKLTRRYGFQPEGPLFVEAFPDHGGFAVRTLGVNGLEGALGVCFGKVIAMDSPRARKAGTFNWGTTLWHEFTHVITLQMTNHNIPRWFTEGLSVMEEHRARPGWGDNIDLSFIRAYQEGKLLKASELNKGFTRPENPERIPLSYLQSALACEWMEEKFGFESIRRSLRLFAANKPAGEVFLETLGLDADGMDAEYTRFIDTRVKEIASHIDIGTLNAAATDTSADTSGDAEKDFLEQRLEDHPDDFFADLRMGALLQKAGALDDAEGYLKKAEDLFPQYVDRGNPYLSLAQIYLKRQREEDALAQLEKWIRVDGNAREPLLKAAEIYRKRKEWASVVRVLGLSVYIHPYDVDTLKELGEASLESENWDQAVAAYQALVALDTADPAGAHLDLAAAFLASGDRSGARRETVRSLEIAPNYLKAQKLLLKLSGDEAE